MIIVTLAVFGLVLGSFTNAFVWRLREQSLPAARRESKGKAKKKDLSISKGRSMCVHCGHTLRAVDLIPVLSWLSLKGKCRYCKKSISWQYPAVELAMAMLFVASYVFWPHDLTHVTEKAALGVWLVSLIGFMALFVYDLRWMLLPNKIIFPMYGLAIIYVVLRTVATSDVQTITSAALGVVVGGGIFYVLFQISSGRWIGGGDVKLGFLFGALVGGPVEAALVLFGASLAGSLITVPLTISGKMTAKTRIPFGPLLIAATVFVVLFGPEVIDWYRGFILLES